MKGCRNVSIFSEYVATKPNINCCIISQHASFFGLEAKQKHPCAVFWAPASHWKRRNSGGAPVPTTGQLEHLTIVGVSGNTITVQFLGKRDPILVVLVWPLVVKYVCITRTTKGYCTVLKLRFRSSIDERVILLVVKLDKMTLPRPTPVFNHACENNSLRLRHKSFGGRSPQFVEHPSNILPGCDPKEPVAL